MDDQIANKLKSEIASSSDSCVMCGMCSAQCPTYRISKQESESPRGRISLIRAWSRGELEIGEKSHQHLQNCLHCGQCERICPSGVPYLSLINQYKANSDYSENLSGRTKDLIQTLSNNKKRRKLFRQLSLLERTGVRRLAGSIGLTRLFKLEEQEKNAPPAPKPVNWKEYYAAQLEQKNQVAFFIGCVGELFDQQAISASINLLNRWGYSIHIPVQQQCCGGLSKHNGFDSEHISMAKTNIQAFAQLKISNIAYFASGCGSVLNHYQQVLETQSTPEELNRFNRQLIDISELILTKSKEQEPRFQPLPKRVLVHHSCTSRNALRNQDNAMELLAKIPRIELISLKMRNNCCGAGGSQLLEPNEINLTLQQDLIEDIKQQQPDVIITSNTGCKIQIENGLRKNGLDIKVMHPVVLFHQQIQ